MQLSASAACRLGGWLAPLVASGPEVPIHAIKQPGGSDSDRGTSNHLFARVRRSSCLVVNGLLILGGLYVYTLFIS